LRICNFVGRWFPNIISSLEYVDLVVLFVTRHQYVILLYHRSNC